MEPIANTDKAALTWIVFVRPIGFPNKPWEQRSVSAHSASHADTILRSAGYEMQTGTAYISSESWPEIEPLKPPALCCTKCEYALNGLTVVDSYVSCPECANKQLVVSWRPNIEPQFEGNSSIMTGLAIVGVVALTFIGLLALFILSSMFY